MRSRHSCSSGDLKGPENLIMAAGLFFFSSSSFLYTAVIIQDRMTSTVEQFE